ncbi:TATA-box-binding protein [archaeon CG10_big_fil_rev_8_21_14_0_10_43_11]|nr:MAG: TATA-box-binding protein [archaeon CG10_big_fil_rev_8_21_14_0_10_43_11]
MVDEIHEDSLKGDITVQNIVASVSLHVEIPLEKVSTEIKNTEYDPEQFPGLVFRIRDPKVSALLFSSGKVVCTGAKEREDINLAVQKIIEALKTIGVEVTKEPDIKVQNIVASGDIHMRLNLNQLVFDLKYAEYEPEQFPGLVYKLPHSHITFLLFGTGKIVCTGAVNIKEINEAVDTLVSTLKGLSDGTRTGA